METLEQIALRVAQRLGTRRNYDADMIEFSRRLVDELAKQEPVACRYKIINAFGDEVWVEKPDRSWRTVIETQPLYLHPTTTPEDVLDAERYRTLRDSEYQLDETGPSVSDSFFNQYFGEDLDRAVDELKARYDAAMAAEGEKK